MRPDRLVVGEVRGAEAFDMLQALNTGHDGSVSTVHANSPADALARLETLVLLAGVALPLHAVRAQVSAAVDAIVQVARGEGGARVVVAVAEVGVAADSDGDRVRLLLASKNGKVVAIDPPTRPARRAGFDLEEVWCQCGRSSSR
jgi:Flp pilus assembly CpaF family ATPase